MCAHQCTKHIGRRESFPQGSSRFPQGSSRPRAARLQKRRDELDLDMVDEDEQESQAWWDAEHNTELGTELGAAAELLEAELSRKDADFDGSEAEWQRRSALITMSRSFMCWTLWSDDDQVAQS